MKVSVFSLLRLNDDREDIRSDVDNTKTCQNAPEDFEDTELNDNEISDIMVSLLDFQEKYFSEIPLAEELVKKFIWNIPKPVYRAFRDARDRGIDVMNPMLFMYLFCVDDPGYSIGKFWDIIISELLMNEENKNLIIEYSNAYITEEDSE